MKNCMIVCVIIALIGTIILSIQSAQEMSKEASYWMKRCDAAEAYIEALEADFPEYMDTTSGSDEYSEYYKYICR